MPACLFYSPLLGKERPEEELPVPGGKEPTCLSLLIHIQEKENSYSLGRKRKEEEGRMKIPSGSCLFFY